MRLALRLDLVYAGREREKPIPSHTIKVTGVSDELLHLLDQRIHAQHATGRAEYVRELIRRDVVTSVPPGWPSRDLTLQELLRPLQEEAALLGDAEESTEEFLRQELKDHRRERRDRTQASTEGAN